MNLPHVKEHKDQRIHSGVEKHDELKDMQNLDALSQELKDTNIKSIVSLFENLDEIPISSR